MIYLIDLEGTEHQIESIICIVISIFEYVNHRIHIYKIPCIIYLLSRLTFSKSINIYNAVTGICAQ